MLTKFEKRVLLEARKIMKSIKEDLHSNISTESDVERKIYQAAPKITPQELTRALLIFQRFHEPRGWKVSEVSVDRRMGELHVHIERSPEMAARSDDNKGTTSSYIVPMMNY
jgi:hypothetical protein